MDKELEKKYDLLSNILYINMWGEAQRNNNLIYIEKVSPGVVESDVCLKIASVVAQIHNVKVVFKCSPLEYFRILRQYKCVFKKDKPFIRVKNVELSARSYSKWLYDISDAQGAPREIWKDVWEYING